MVTIYYDDQGDDIKITANETSKFRLMSLGLRLNQLGEYMWSCSVNYVRELSKGLVPIKDIVKIDESFNKWKEKDNSVLIVCDVIHAKIFNRKIEIPHTEIQKVTRYFFKAAVNMKSYQSGKWDGYINLYDKRSQKFPTGLLTDVLSVLRQKKIPYTVEYSYDRKPPRQFNWVVNDGFILDDDQVEAIEAVRHGLRGVVKAPTGMPDAV